MKKNLLVLMTVLLTAGSPVFEIDVDSQEPVKPWTFRTYAKSAPVLKANLHEGGTNYYSLSNWSAFFWYGTNWSDTNYYRVDGSISTNAISFQMQTNTFLSTGTYYGSIVLSNTTQSVAFGRGYVIVN